MDWDDKLFLLIQKSQSHGYKNYVSVPRLIEEEHLQTYLYSKGKANRLKYHQIFALAVPKEKFLAKKNAPNSGDSK